MAKSVCSRSYHRLSPDQLDTFGAQIRAGMADNPTVFTTPPVTDAQFHTLIDNYIAARADYKTGGSAQKPAYDNAKDALMVALDDTADYVDGIADGNTGTITLARYTPTKTSGTDVPPPVKPENIKVTRGETGELYAECEIVEGADSYGCIVIANMPLPSIAGFNAVGQFIIDEEESSPATLAAAETKTFLAFDMNKARKKKFMGLQAGSMYYFYFYAVNASGVSPMSDAKSLMCG